MKRIIERKEERGKVRGGRREEKEEGDRGICELEMRKREERSRWRGR